MAPSKRQTSGENAYRGSQKRIKVAIVSSRVTRLASLKSTMAAVFLTTELLENILEYLPMKDLLLAQRVSRNWKDVITKSTSLQQLLFFTPKQADFSWEFEYRDDPPIRKWPRKVHRNQALPDPLPDGVYEMKILKQGEINPMLFISDVDSIKDFSVQGWGDEITKLVPQARLQHPSISYPEASWRRMLFSQPPTKSLNWYGKDGEGPSTPENSFYENLALETFITCQHFLDAADGRWERCMWFGISGMDMLPASNKQVEAMLTEQAIFYKDAESYDKREKV